MMLKNTTAHTHAFSAALKSVILPIDNGNTVHSCLQLIEECDRELAQMSEKAGMRNQCDDKCQDLL